MKTLDYRHIARLPGSNGSPGPRGILLTDSAGTPARNPDGTQAGVVLEALLLQQTGNQKFTAGREAVDAIELQLEVRKAIKDQCAIDDGLIVLEDAHAQPLIDAILRPVGGYNPAISHCLGGLMSGAKIAVSGDLRAKLKTEGAAAAEPTEAPAN